MAAVIAYFVAVLCVGVWSKKAARGEEAFFVAGRRGGSLLVTGSLVATIVGGSATVGVAGLGFTYGLAGAWWLLVGGVGLLALSVLAPRIRKFALYTLPELVERQYDARVGLAAAALIVVAWTGIVAGQIVAVGKLLAVVGTGSVTLWMVIFTLVFLAYAMLGGQQSVMRTDVVQASVFLAGIAVALVSMWGLTGGIEGWRGSLPEHHFSFPLSGEFGCKQLLSFFLLVGSAYVVGPDMYTRVFSARDGGVARRSAVVAALFVCVFAFVMALIGMAARVLYPDVAPEQCLPYVIERALPPGLDVVVLVALVAALMSSADTCVLGQSVVLAQDILRRLRPGVGQRIVMVTRLSTVGLGLVGLCLALVLQGVISSLMFAYTVFTCGLVVPVVAGLFKDRLRVTSGGALSALIGGGGLGLLSKLPLGIGGGEDLGLVAFGASAALLFGVSLIQRGQKGGGAMV
ncbi:MAG: sodium:solute symporter family protein [Chloroflexota bacterium]